MGESLEFAVEELSKNGRGKLNLGSGTESGSEWVPAACPKFQREDDPREGLVMPENSDDDDMPPVDWSVSERTRVSTSAPDRLAVAVANELAGCAEVFAPFSGLLSIDARRASLKLSLRTVESCLSSTLNG